MNIIIVEDQLMFREAIRKVCVKEFRYHVVAETSSGADAIELITCVKPDVVILDLSIEEVDGFVVAAHVRRFLPQIRILVLSCSVDDFTIFRLEKCGVHGFIDKSTNSVAELKQALRALSDGRTYFSAAFKTAQRNRKADPRSFDKLLSASEQKVLVQIGAGRDDHEIASHMNISPTTVQTHRSNVLQKLQIQGTPKLIVYAIKLGFTIGINF